MILLPDGGTVIVGQYYRDMFARRYDKDGNIRWSNKYPKITTSEAYHVELKPNGNYLVSGTVGRRLWLSELRALDGVPVLDFKIFETPSRITLNDGFISQHPDGGYVVNGFYSGADSSFFGKYDRFYTYQWGSVINAGTISKAYVNTDGTIIMTVYSFTDSIRIGRYSATGRLLGKVSWPNDPRRILKGAAYSGFGDAVFAGYQDNAFTPSGFFDDFYFARVSGVGNHYCSSQFFCPEDSTWIGTDTVGNVKPVSNRVYLGQNMPNPVGESTSIPYFIPEGVKQAEIIVHDVSGRELSTIPLLQSKHGIHLFSLSGMPSGIYAYSLITDGTPIATLKMVVIK